MLNFPEIWLKRVIHNLQIGNAAPWLEGIPELSTPIQEIGAGTMTEKNKIHVPVSMFEPDVLVNNTAYPIPNQDYDDDTLELELDKFQSKQVSVSDDEVMGASYNKIDEVTRGHVNAILKKKYAKAIHSMAPVQNTTDTPVITATGAADPAGRARLIYDDLITLKEKLNEIGAEDDLRLVLCTSHMNDLLLDRKNFGDQLVNYKAGQPAPVIAGFQIFSYGLNPYFDASNKRVAFGAAPGAGENRASVVFYTPNIAKKTGNTKKYFAKADTDPANQTNRMNFRHYFMALPMLNKYIGAITSQTA